jgi:hypothetical protein
MRLNRHLWNRWKRRFARQLPPLSASCVTDWSFGPYPDHTYARWSLVDAAIPVASDGPSRPGPAPFRWLTTWMLAAFAEVVYLVTAMPVRRPRDSAGALRALLTPQECALSLL